MICSHAHRSHVLVPMLRFESRGMCHNSVMPACACVRCAHREPNRHDGWERAQPTHTREADTQMHMCARQSQHVMVCRSACSTTTTTHTHSTCQNMLDVRLLLRCFSWPCLCAAVCGCSCVWLCCVVSCCRFVVVLLVCCCDSLM